ncbi:hypothetical protein SAMN04488072_102127 [Lentibacillus halodurans]|uniref:Uncharacterized protein n=1 Tax=Lentibacillus halodurans TaxID=237679 RepID=A0A1I0W381_9BACI|nr:hypothetical protein [Lentibacillus halodurans]SFA82346.1 hypothetical protein SAMN04488072_102127 [Lentibacillus halodurans]
MVVLVENCFHWIGFHIVNHLLENGYNVDGTDKLNTDKKEHLSMFVGRHELFRHISPLEKRNAYDAFLRIDDDELKLEKNHPVIIKLPIIFGEWMPMSQEGMYVQHDFIRFDSEQFLSEAVYVKNVLKSLQQWIHSSDLPSVLEVKSFHDRRTDNVKLENAIYIRNNRPIAESINIVKDHYEMYKKFYSPLNKQ